MKSLYVNNNIEGIKQGLDFLESTLVSYKLKPKYIQEALLLTEESLVKFIEKAEEGVLIKISKKIETANITLISSGEEISVQDTDMGINIASASLNKQTESILRDAVLKAYSDKINYKYKNGCNTLKITAGLPMQKSLFEILAGIVLAVGFGLLLRQFVGLNVISVITDYILDPIEKLFFNSLQATVIPVMFFAIITVVSKFIDFSESSIVGAKIIVWYIFTAVIAVIIAVGLVSIIKPGVPGLGKQLFNYHIDSNKVVGNLSFLDQLYTIVPNNIVRPFLTNNTIQVVLMAMVTGIAVGALSDYKSGLSKFFNTGNALFSQIIEFIQKLTPYIVFIIIFSTVLKTGTKTFSSIGLYLLTIICGVIGLLILYSILVCIFARINPIKYLFIIIPIWKNLFRIGTDGETIAYLIKESKKRFKIKSQIPTLIITIGNTLNMDTSCLYLGVGGMFLARFYGVNLFGSSMVSVIISIIIMSIGCPNGLGANIIAMTLLVQQLGMPIESMALIIATDAIVSILFMCTNAIGDLSNSIVVSKTEGYFDSSQIKRN